MAGPHSPAAPANPPAQPRLQRDLTKLDNPKGRVSHLALPAGSCPRPYPAPIPLNLSLSPSSPLCFRLYGLCFLVFHSDKCNMNGKEAPRCPGGQLGKPGKETPHPHLPHLSVGFFAVLKCETLSRSPTAPDLLSHLTALF